MSFHEVQFPTAIGYGTSGGPGFSTNVVVTDGGSEQRIARWATARRQYSVNFGGQDPKSLADLRSVQAFYIARQGVLNGFRFKDFTDFQSLDAHAPAFNDQVIATGNGTITTFQLTKSYTSGDETRVRNITKPVSGTVKIGVDGTELTTGWTVNTTSGVVTFDTAPGNGLLVTAGYEFDVPVRFGVDLDSAFMVRHDFYDGGSTLDISLVEILDSVVVPGEFFYGGAEAISLTANYTMSAANVRVVDFVDHTTSKTVKLPDIATIPPGGPTFYLYNKGTADIFVQDHSGASLATLAAGDAFQAIIGGTSGTPTWELF